MEDTYRTLAAPSEEVLLKEKSSKFFGYAFPVESEEEIRSALDNIRKQHPTARHWCYAWQLGTTDIRYRANDDGEPSHTAGTPIYGQIQSFGVTNVLVIVARYFGGIKLGAGGLIVAYRETARMALEASDIVEKTVESRMEIHVSYKDLNRVMRVVRENRLTICEQDMTEDCRLVVACRKRDENAIFEIFNSMFGIDVKIQK